MNMDQVLALLQIIVAILTIIGTISAGGFVVYKYIKKKNPNSRFIKFVDTMIDAVFGGNGDTKLMKAVKNGHSKEVYFLVDAGEDVNARTKPGVTALMMAAYNGDTDTVCLLIGAGADVDVRDKQGKTALKLAEARGDIKITEMLRGAGAH